MRLELSCTDKMIFPVRIVCERMTNNSKRLLYNRNLQTSLLSKEEYEERCAEIRAGGYVLIDFGRELNGGIMLAVSLINGENENGRCRIVFGESFAEALSSICIMAIQNI